MSCALVSQGKTFDSTTTTTNNNNNSSSSKNTTRMSDKNKLSLAANRNGRLMNCDSDSDSDYYVEEETEKDSTNNNNNAEPDEDCPWQSAVDPNSGKTYYYHIHTRETQWSKPAEMGSREERAALAAKEKQQKDFFAAMEANILNTISQGFKAPEKKNRLDLEFESKEISEDPLDVSSGVASSASTHSRSPRRRVAGGGGKAPPANRPNLIRTISSMDTGLLSDLIKRVPSSRHVVRGASQKSIGGRQQSNISLSRGSSHRSVGNRKGRIMRGVGERRGSAVSVARKSQSANKVDDDDELPPLTVVTTPDLRRRGGSTKEFSNPRDALSRDNSMTMDQLLGSAGGSGGGGSLGDSNFLDNAANGSRFAFDNSFSLDGSMGDHSGGLLSHLDSSHNRSLGGFGGSNHSLDASDKSFGGGGSAGHLSVSSNLLPVEEGMNENFDSSPCLRVDANTDIVLEGDQEGNDCPEDQSFSFGMESGGDFGQGDNTANWLDALPADETALDREDIVGYGNNAKPFKDAGFTSFFDESLANFDLSDKETQQLQKLALMSEQMAKVLESEEDSEESEEESSSSESSDDLEEMADLNQGGNVEYELNLGADVEYQLSFGDAEKDAESIGVPLTPSFHTPKTASTTKTTETATPSASVDSPINRPSKPPPRRTLGAKTANVRRALKSIDPLDDDKEIVLSPQLRLGGMALTSDNAGGHFAPSLSITPDNARSRFAGMKDGSMPGLQKAVRRNTGDKNSLERIKRPTLVDGLGDMNSSCGSIKSTKSTKSTSSTSSKSIHAAARRLSMFSLKHVDRSKLRHVGDTNSPKVIKNSSAKGKGSLQGAKQMTRPELVRRNTCGTLYVGATMSAPDKDATIKCVCGVFRAHILQSELSGDHPEASNFHLFNDLESQQKQSAKRRGSEYKPTKVSVPSLDQITTFYRDVFKRAQVEYDCIIISLIYVERLIKTTNGVLRPNAMNWRSILFSSMVLASKVWDDLSMWNADFSQTCPNGVRFSLKRINELEIAVLSALSYKVKVPASEYAKYYFLLRSMLIKSGLIAEDADTSTPLDLEGAKRLQEVSSQFQSGIGATKKQMKKAKYMRSKSMGTDGAWKLSAASRKARAQNSKVGLEHVVQM